jgi:hypothetical protein
LRPRGRQPLLLRSVRPDAPLRRRADRDWDSRDTDRDAHAERDDLHPERADLPGAARAERVVLLGLLRQPSEAMPSLHAGCGLRRRSGVRYECERWHMRRAHPDRVHWSADAPIDEARLLGAWRTLCHTGACAPRKG